MAEFIERHPDAFGGSTLDAENTYCRRVQEVSVSDANTPSELDEVADFFGGLAEWLGYTDATTVAQMLNELADRSRAYLGWYGADEP